MILNWPTLALAIAIALVLIDVVVRVLSVIFVPRNRRPQTATAWLLAIFSCPTSAFCCFG